MRESPVAMSVVKILTSAKLFSWHDSFLRQSYRFVETLDWFQRKFLLTLFQQSITKPNKLIVLKQRSQTVINCTTQNVIRKCKQSSPQFISYDIIMFAD